MFVGALDKTGLDNIASMLLCGKRKEVLLGDGNDACAVIGGAVFQYVLCYVVAEFVGDELIAKGMKFIHDDAF